MIDRYGRNINKLRVSVTEACDLACVYCVDRLGAHRVAPDQLTHPSLLKLVGFLKNHAGIEKIRVTGGEPLVYPHLLEFISGLTALGLDDIGLTTNGQHLAKKVTGLKAAGLKHINVSLDSLKPEGFRRLARTGHLHKTLEGLEAALAIGLRVKINMVVMKGENDSEVVEMLEYGVARGIEVRYLELMKMGPLFKRQTDLFFPMEAILKQISSRYPIRPTKASEDSTSPSKKAFACWVKASP